MSESACSVGLVGYGVDTLVLNVRYTDKQLEPCKRELDEALQAVLDELQQQARAKEGDGEPVVSPWMFHGLPLLAEPSGAGRQWRWRLSCRWLALVVSPGKFNDIIAQVRFAAEYLWCMPWLGDAISEVHGLLRSIFGQYIHLQVSEVHLCADVMGYDFSSVDYEQAFVSRSRLHGAVYGAGVDEVLTSNRRVSSLCFSTHGAPISATIYDKTLEIAQKSHKTWFYDYWKREKPGCVVWDGVSPVWRVEVRFRRAFLRNLKQPIEGPYEFLSLPRALWLYAVGQPGGDVDGLPDGWLRHVVPTDDTNHSRWPVHPVWLLIQSAFAEEATADLGPVVRERIRQVNVERGLAAVIGYCSTLAAWLGGEYASTDTDVSLVLHWLSEAGVSYLDERERVFVEEVKKKQVLYGVCENA